MPGGKTKWNNKWLDQVDDNGVLVGLWCKCVKDKTDCAYCTLCCKEFSINNSGFNQVKQHSKTSKHKQISDVRFGKGTAQKLLLKNDQTATSGIPTASATSTFTSSEEHVAKDSAEFGRKTSHTISKFMTPSLQNQVSESEILWCYKVASSDFSFRSCDNIDKLFQRMFKCDVSEQFSLSRTKASYVVSEAIRPFLLESIVKDVIDSNLGFVLMFDETTTAQQCRQMDILIRYWNQLEAEVSVRFLKAFHFGHATAEIVSEALLSLEEEPELKLPLKNLISISSDGPNVNKSIHRQVNENLKRRGYHGLLDFEPCNLHTVHNAFRKGLNSFGSGAEDLTFDMHQFFKQQPVRREDFSNLQLEYDMNESLFLRHVPTRWLTLLPAMNRVLKNWTVSLDYFTVKLPKSKKSNTERKNLEKNERYQRICQGLKDKNLLFQFAFLTSVTPLFERFLTMFQTKGPIIHILTDECSTLLRTFMFRFLKADVVGRRTGRRLLDIDVTDLQNQLPDEGIEIGVAGKQQLLQIPKERHHLTFKHVRSFYVTVSEYLALHLPLRNELLTDMQYLHPILQKHEKGSNAIASFATKLPHVVSKEELPTLKNEWLDYSTSKIPTEWSEDEDGNYLRIDHYWNKVTDQKTKSGHMKYPILAKVIKSALTLAHGNADVERSLSDNKNTVTPERTGLSIETINGLRLAKDKVNQVKGPHNIQISNKQVSMARRAKSMYEDRLRKEKEEAERRKKELTERKTEKESLKKEQDQIRMLNEGYDKQEKALKKEEDEYSNVLKSAEVLLKEATTKLGVALKAKNDVEIQVAQGMLESAENRMEKGRKGIESCQQKRHNLSEKRSAVIIRNKQLSSKSSSTKASEDTDTICHKKRKVSSQEESKKPAAKNSNAKKGC